MPRRPWVSIAMLAAGAALLFGASTGNAQTRKGGVFRVGTTGASVQVDPQVAYITTAWWLEYATAAKLYNYPDKRGPAGTILRPEVASRFLVSKNGKRYTFFIRKGFRFSDGTPVTAKSFAYAIDRTVNEKLASPGAPLIADQKGTEIVGAYECARDETCTHVPGVVVRGNRLIIRLVRPDGTFLSKITMPFFQATSTKLPLTEEVVDVDSIDDIPSAGPYAFSRNDHDVLTSIRRNPYWHRGPGRNRPRNLAGLDVQWNLNEGTAFNQVKTGELDEGPIPATVDWLEFGRQYGVNKARFWTMPQNCTGYLPMNMSRPLFRGNLKLRRAISYALDRSAYVSQAGPYAGQPWTHLLNPGVPGWRNVNPYPLTPDVSKARALAAGHLRDGKITIAYRSSGTINPAQAQIVRQDLINIGFEPGNITMKGFSGSGWYGNPLAGADIGVSMGWCSDYPDAYDWFNNLLYGATVDEDWTANYSHMNLPIWNRRMDAVTKLVGPKRHKAYGQLDLDIMRKVAPIAVERTYNSRYFFSDRVRPRSLVYQGIYSDWSIPALEVK